MEVESDEDWGGCGCQLATLVGSMHERKTEAYSCSEGAMVGQSIEETAVESIGRVDLKGGMGE